MCVSTFPVVVHLVHKADKIYSPILRKKHTDLISFDLSYVYLLDLGS